MLFLLARVIAAGLAVACVSLPCRSLAQPIPFTVDHLLAMEEFGSASLSPDGRWAAFERREAYETAPRFDRFYMTNWAVTGLWLVDLQDPATAPRRVLESEQAGIVLGPWSPTGRHLLIFRLDDNGWEAGVLDPADHTVRWTGLTPDLSLEGRTVQWRDDDRLVLVIRPEGDPPWPIRRGGGSQAVMTRQWAAMAEGRVASRTVVGSGRMGGDTARAAAVSVVELDLRTGAVRTLMTGAVTDIEMSHDGRAVAALEHAEDVPVDPVRPVRMRDTTHRRRLALIGLDDGVIRRLDPRHDVWPGLLRWSITTDKLLVWARQDGTDWTSGGLLRVDPASARTTDFDHAGLQPPQAADGLITVNADWLGTTPLLYGRRSDGSRLDWHLLSETPVNLTAELDRPAARLAAVSERSVTMIADGAAWTLTAEVGPKRLTPQAVSLTPVSTTSALDPPRLRTGDTPYQSWAFGIDPVGRLHRTGDSSTTAPGHRDLSSMAETTPTAVSPTAAIRRKVDRGVGSLWLETPTAFRRIAEVNGALAEVDFAERRLVAHLDPNGKAITSWLHLPPDHASRSNLPVIVLIYPGATRPYPISETGTFSAVVDPEVLAGAGYAVLTPSMPRSGYQRENARHLAREIHAALDAAIAQIPALDGDRVALMGHSFGGYATLAIATESARFRSLVVMAAPSNLLSVWGEFDPVQRALPEDGLMIRQAAGWVETGQAQMLNPPWAASDTYIRRSPVSASDRISAPILLIHGDRDFVPLSQAEAVFSAMYRQGKDAKLVTYWGEGHAFFSPANIRDMYEQIFDWLNETMPASVAVPERRATSDPDH